ncbi:class I SAM-dependent methyltransferase [Nakamurella sp.]|uniref:class I SAM-dependent methyltransferase n=1 Tax=Nakamurella sp. TaxID=1869182 RepID=UPI0037850E49
MDQRDRIAAMFDQAADSYDQVGVELFQPIAERLVRELAPQPGEHAVDLGCGRGAALLRLAAAVAPTGRTVGLDLAPRMVQAAAEGAARAGHSVDVVIGDAQSPELPPGSFDVVASSLVAFFLPDPAAAVRAWRHLLVDHGRLGVSTFGAFSPWWAQVDAVFAPFLPPAMLDARTTGTQGPFASDDGVEQLLADAGFGSVRTVGEVLPVRFDDVAHWYRWTMSTGQRFFWHLVPDEQHASVYAAAAAALDDTRHHTGDGRIGFDQRIRYTIGHR